MSDKNLSYKITDNCLYHVASLEKNLAILNQSELSSAARGRILSESLFDDLFAVSNHLHLHLTLGDIKKISIGKDVESVEAKVLSNIRQVFDFVHNNFRQKNYSFNFQFIQHVVKLLQSGILEVWDVGKIRVGGEVVEKNFELNNQKYDSNDATNILADAVLWVEEEKEVHPLVKACVLMMLINSTSPFVGLNYISSIVFFRLILEKYQYGTSFNIPLFKMLISKSSNFREVIEKSLKPENSVGITEVINSSALLLDELISQYKNDFIRFDYFEIKSNTDKLDINERQLKLLQLLQQKVYVRRYEFVKMFKVSPMTAYRDLNFLVERKLLKVSGTGKATTYTLISK